MKKTPLKTTVRINKYLADTGVTTRRKADDLISKGIVFINGKTAVLGSYVRDGDKVTVGKQSEDEVPRVYYAYNKPEGIVTVGGQGKDKSIKDAMEFPIPVFPIGRLDKDSEGLIIMTNDGRITSRLLGPEYNHEKEYRVRVNKNIEHQLLVNLNNGVRLGKEVTLPAKTRRVEKKIFDIVLTEGKNRQIRRMCGAYSYDVTQLTRIRIMNIELKNLRKGSYRPIEGKELKTFLDSLGLPL
jgi:23S rRNA pseudouridine2604 synthase